MPLNDPNLSAKLQAALSCDTRRCGAMRSIRQSAWTLLLLLTWAFACSSSPAQQPDSVPPVSATVTVLGSPEPITLGETNRSSVVLDVQQHPLAFGEVEDYLRTDSSIFVEQRGAGGSQADISIRGTSFEQTLVLLNGLRINDAETSHNNMDIPLPLGAMRSIDVLHGAGSTLYGSDAIGGVIDFVTAVPTESSLLLRAGGGNYATNEQELLLSAAGKRWSEVLAAERDASSGFMFDRDYRDLEGSSETRYRSRWGASDVLLAADDRAFGANQFYGNYPSYERTKGWFASMHQSLGEHTQAAFGYRRHTDEYILFRDNPAIYENNHVDSSWEGALRRDDAAGGHARLFYGLEGDGDEIHSNNLGVHARNWGAGYLDAELRGRRASLTAGLREEVISGGYRVTSPMLAGGMYVTRSLKLRAAAGYGFRLPTYLDLYYSDPTTVGNPNLKPESTWNFETGADWFPRSHLFFSTTGFYSRQRNTIDYVRTHAGEPWMATNLSGLRFAGWESAATWDPGAASHVRIAYTLLSGAQRALHGLESEYVFNYPIHNARIEATHVWKGSYLLATRVGIVQRYERDPYAVWDVSVADERGWLHPYVRVTNLTNTGYQEVLDVQMPGRQIVAGLEFVWHR
jgi:outer membrane cobalamin receptor